VNTGLGFSEIFFIVVIVLMFFGSKEIPSLIRNIAKVLARIRHYTDKVKSELDSVVQTTAMPVENSGVSEKKKTIREQFVAARKELGESLRKEKSAIILKHLKNTDIYKQSVAIMVYVSSGSEVETHELIKEMLATGKRVVIPYCKGDGNALGITEIYDLERDLTSGTFDILEPAVSIRKPFFKTDLQLILCPGVAFDSYGGRLGRGKAYYDTFLKDIKSQIPIYGIAFDCQIALDPLPFDYHDITMDQIITESGFKIAKEVGNIAYGAKMEIPAIPG
jgi:5-formyltetrahydrofolate cyclo-ligase